MITRHRQAGMSIPGMLIIAIMVGFFMMCTIKLAPPYIEYMSVKDIVTKVSEEYVPGKTTTGQMRRRIANLFNTNQITALSSTDVEIYRKGGKTFIDGSYEYRTPIIGRIDAIMRFDDLLYVAGQITPQ